MNKFQKFVREEIVDENPITSDAGCRNFCKYCEVSWAEDTFTKYLEHESNPREPNHSFEHHREDCLWVKANRLIMED